MPKNVKIKLNDNLEKDILKAVSRNIKEMPIDVKCPNCHKETHLSFSGDSCEFCGLVINYGVDLQI